MAYVHMHHLMRTLLPLALALFAPAQAQTDSGGGDYRNVTVATLNYTDPYDGTLLMGYYAVPGTPEAPDGPRPAVVIFPDWDGVNDYEKTRAEMLASELGYVAMAADVYGLDNHQPESFEERAALTTLYRENITLSNARVKAAVDFVKGLEMVDAGKGVIIMGYCFGGTVVLNNALSGSDDSIAAIAFHGGLTSVAKGMNEMVKAKVLIFSGGEDSQDSTQSVVEMEAALNSGNSTWELDRYSDVAHGFTKFDSRSYNLYVDERSWESTKRFLREVFGELVLNPDIPDEVTVEPVNYTDVDGSRLKGYVSYPSPTVGDNVPAVIIIHDASGIDEYEQTRAQMLSDLGYVGFASDIYGDHGYDLSNSTQRFELLNSIRDDVPFFVQRIRAAVDKVKTLERVDPDNIAIIGYCFGGTGVIDYAMVGESDAKAVVSFHGGLSKVAPVGGKVHVKMLVQSGGDDDASSSIEALEGAMEAGNATWEYARYSDVLHSFTNWNDTRGRYNLRADVRSWESMKTFLAGAFAEGEPELTMPTEVPIAVSMTVMPVVVPVAEPTEAPVAVKATAMPMGFKDLAEWEMVGPSGSTSRVQAKSKARIGTSRKGNVSKNLRSRVKSSKAKAGKMSVSGEGASGYSSSGKSGKDASGYSSSGKSGKGHKRMKRTTYYYWKKGKNRRLNSPAGSDPEALGAA